MKMQIQKIPNQIINGSITPLNLNRVNYIALHHAATMADVKAIENAHVNGNGWNAIGYNYFIALDGTIYEGRGYKYMSASVVGHNNHIESICFQGDYQNTLKTMPDEQFNAGVELISWLRSVLPRNAEIVGHKYFGGSVCPGQYFPLEEMKKLKKREESEMIYNYIDENMPQWARPTIQKLVDKGLLKGNEKGELGLNDTMLKIFVINDRAGVYGD